MTSCTPSSPILFPLKLSSLIDLLKVKHSSRALIPANEISFFFILKTSKYFLSLMDWPSAIAPSANSPFMLRPNSVMYFLFSKTLLTALAPPGPMKLLLSYNSRRVD